MRKARMGPWRRIPRLGVIMSDKITYTCSSCGRQLAVNSDAAGLQAQCPACRTINIVPTPGVSPAEPTPSVSSAEPRPEVPTAAPPQTQRPAPSSEGITHFLTEVAGVTDLDLDGTSCQEAVRQCQPGEILTLIHVPASPDNDEMVKVCRLSGEQVGHLPHDIVERRGGASWSVSSRIKQGYEAAAWVAQITGGGGKDCGLNIAVVLVPPGTTHEAVASYVQRVSAEISEQSVSPADVPSDGQVQAVRCDKCGNSMLKAKANKYGKRGVIGAIALFVIGLGLVFLFWPWGTIVGVLLWVLAVMVGRHERVWWCQQCRRIKPRKEASRVIS